MALIIKGNMPSCCAVCCDCNSADDGNFCNRTGNRLGNDWQLYRPLNCPIIGEIPDKYGELIERGTFVDKVKSEWYRIHEETGYDIKGIYWNSLLEANDKAPTVLEASK